MYFKVTYLWYNINNLCKINATNRDNFGKTIRGLGNV